MYTVKWLNMQPIDGTQTDITTSDKGGLGSNGYEEVLHIPQNSRTETWQSEAV